MSFSRRWSSNQFSPNDYSFCSVRISNELGAGHPRTAKFSVVVVVITAFLMGLCMSLILIILRKPYPSVFTNSAEVRKLVYHLTPLLAFSITLNNVQPVLSGTINFFSFLFITVKKINWMNAKLVDEHSYIKQFLTFTMFLYCGSDEGYPTT